MDNKIQIQLKNGRVLAANLYNYDGKHPEIVVTLEDPQTGLVEQDIALVRIHEEEDQAHSEDERVEVLVWGDACDENYTEKYVVDQYCGDEES